MIRLTGPGTPAKSLPDSSPDYTIEVTDTKGVTYRLDMYPLRKKNGETDVFRALVRFDNENRLLVVRYVVLDLLRQTLGHFTVK